MNASRTIAGRLEDMEIRAKQCGVSVQAICDAARIAASTWADWKAENLIPSASDLCTVGAALAALIEASDPGPVEVQVAQW